MSDDYTGQHLPGVNDVASLAPGRPTVDRLWTTPSNPETDALKSCADALDQLDPTACARVLTYLTDRYTPAPAPTPEETP